MKDKCWLIRVTIVDLIRWEKYPYRVNSFAGSNGIFLSFSILQCQEYERQPIHLFWYSIPVTRCVPFKAFGGKFISHAMAFAIKYLFSNWVYILCFCMYVCVCVCGCIVCNVFHIVVSWQWHELQFELLMEFGFSNANIYSHIFLECIFCFAISSVYAVSTSFLHKMVNGGAVQTIRLHASPHSVCVCVTSCVLSLLLNVAQKWIIAAAASS